jgi:two-component system, chemotaxis family, sensor kinase CheA
MAADAALVIDFVEQSKLRLRDINDRLKALPDEPRAQRDTLDRVFRAVHSHKGQATALGLNGFAAGCHSVEETLSRLRAQPVFGGSDWIPVNLGIAGLHGDFDRVERLIEQLAAYGQRAPVVRAETTPRQTAFATLDRLARTVADAHGKRVELHMNDLEILGPTIARRLASDVLPQLVRNAVVHGIEEPTVRLACGKPGVGRIFISVTRDENAVVFSVRDDGQGIATGGLRDNLTRTGRFSVEAIALMDEKSLVASLFESGVSTANAVDEHAGRGVGLDIVKDMVLEAGGRIRVISQPGRFSEFRLSFPAATVGAVAA